MVGTDSGRHTMYEVRLTITRILAQEQIERESYRDVLQAAQLQQQLS